MFDIPVYNLCVFTITRVNDFNRILFNKCVTGNSRLRIYIKNNVNKIVVCIIFKTTYKTCIIHSNRKYTITVL